MQEVRAVVSKELDAVNAVIIEQLRSDVEMVENVGQYIVDAGGKRLRPVLVLLSSAALGSISELQIRFAAVVEFIHTATLLHDDVVDVSELRRGRPTANSAFGNASSVLVGDFLYTRAFQLMVTLGNHDVLKMMADTTNTIAAGEVLQLIRAGDSSTSEDQYYDVIDRKTAALFAAGCQGAALLAGADSGNVRDLNIYGRNVGIAFQIVDDLLDYQGDPEVTGKNVGDDLAEGKPTLPLIHVMREGSNAQATLVREAINAKDRERLPDIIQAVKDCGSLEYTREAAVSCRDKALGALKGFPESPAKKAMINLAALSLERSH
ncbi:polyprenyl synthetase family protein [Congregibacter litoralis]|uniref:Octaprenyl diphosphate synthase n=1 Tax=Congregibacter litoralis KT71 TaxID=314285 RepID=A4A647_9GAMM|nr:polyprenyl synthetase family protein [Congregibacter litoralis]EAQ98494.1 Geranylgeranyl pyrophosphate synthase [Congregibacter litoralis KT71]